jgi:integrase/recombinase XerD
VRLDEPFGRWVSRLVSRDVSVHTRAGYLSDCLAVGLCHLETLGRPRPAIFADAEAMAAAAAQPRITRLRGSGVRPATYVQTLAVLAALDSDDLTLAVTEESFAAHAAGRAPASRTRAVSAWRGFLQFLVRSEVLAANPMDRIDWDRPRKRLPKPLDARVLEDLVRTVREPDPRARRPWPARDLALFGVLYATGIRLSEATEATIGGLQYWDTMTPMLRVLGKGRKPRVIRVADETRAVVDAYLRERTGEGEAARPLQPEDPLFVRSDGSQFTSSALRRLVDGWYRRAGHSPPEGAVVHALRHTFATDAIRGGAPLRDLQEVMGHSSLETTAGYLKVLGEAGEEVIRHHPSRDLLRER